MVAAMLRCVVSVLFVGVFLSSIAEAVEQRMYFEFSGEMDLGPRTTTVPDSAKTAWETLTGEFFSGYLDEIGVNLTPPLRGTTVTLTVTSNQGLFFAFDAKADFIADSSANHDPGFLLLGILEDTDQFFDYITILLQSQEPAFGDITSLSLSVQESTPVAPPPSNWIGPSPTVVDVTQAPTKRRTEAPTAAPVTTPVTKPPTMSPTPDTTAAQVDTAAPVTTPTEPDWQSPVTSPPSSSGTAGGVNDEDLHTFYVTTELVLKDTLGEMGESTLATWRNVTSIYIIEYIHSLMEDEDKGELGVDFLEIRQIRQTFGGSRRLKSLRNRRLQVPSESESYLPLHVEFVSRLSLFRKYDAESLVNGAFATIRRRRTYLDLLIETAGEDGDTFFDSVSEVGFGRDIDSGELPSPDNGLDPPEEGDPRSSSSTLGIIVGVAVGVIAFVLALAVIYFFNKRGKNKTTKGGFEAAASPNIVPSPDRNGTGGLSWEEADGPGLNFNKEIIVERMDDVSTIGDPFTVYGDDKTVTDKTVGTKSVTQTMLYSYLLGGGDEKEQYMGEEPASPNSSLMGLQILKDAKLYDLDGSMLGEQPSADPSTLIGLGLLGNDEGRSTASLSRTQQQ